MRSAVPTLLWLLAGCGPSGPCDPEPVTPDRPTFAAILSDFQVGGVALADPDGIGPLVLPTSGDALIRVVDGTIYVVERGTVDVLTALDPALPETPLWQVALPQGANAHDLVGYDGALWLPCYGNPEVLVLEPADGSVRDRIDLADYAEGLDRNPELDRAVVADGRFFVAAQRLYEEDGSTLVNSDDGLLIELSASGQVVATTPTGPNPRIAAGPGDTVLVMTGLYVFPGTGPERATDGALAVFDPATGTLGEPLLTEDGFDLFGVTVAGTHAVVLSVDLDSRSEAVCVDLSAGTVTGRWSDWDGWYITAVADADSASPRVILGVRAVAEGPQRSGSLAFDPVACAPERPEPTCSVLPPYDFASF